MSPCRPAKVVRSSVFFRSSRANHSACSPRVSGSGVSCSNSLSSSHNLATGISSRNSAHSPRSRHHHPIRPWRPNRVLRSRVFLKSSRANHSACSPQVSGNSVSCSNLLSGSLRLVAGISLRNSPSLPRARHHQAMSPSRPAKVSRSRVCRRSSRANHSACSPRVSGNGTSCSNLSSSSRRLVAGISSRNSTSLLRSRHHQTISSCRPVRVLRSSVSLRSSRANHSVCSPRVSGNGTSCSNSSSA